MRWLLVGALVSLTACGRSDVDVREPEPRELALVAEAAEANDPALCARISPVAFQAEGERAAGFQISRVRSRCYYDLAIRHDRPELCQHVVPMNALLHDGSAYSEDGCHHAVEGRRRSVSAERRLSETR